MRLDDILAAHKVGAGFLRFLLFFAAGDREHALGLAKAVRKDDRAAHHLIGVLGIDAQTKRQFHGLVEFRVFDLLHERDRVFDRIRSIGDDLRTGGCVFLAVCSHLTTSVVQSSPFGLSHFTEG